MSRILPPEQYRNAVVNMDDNTEDFSDDPGSHPLFHRRSLFRHPVTAAEKFHAAVRDSDVEYVRNVLQEKGQNGGRDPACFINSKDERGRSALSVAIRRGNISKLSYWFTDVQLYCYIK